MFNYIYAPFSLTEKELERLPYKPEGYNYWTWRDHKIHYVVQGEGTPILLIHGFGASAFHWRFVSLSFSVVVAKHLQVSLVF